MRNLIAWTMTLAAGASAVATASGQSAPATPKKQAPAAVARPAPKPARAPLDPEAVKARQVAERKAREEMDTLLAEWEKQSKKVASLYVEFERVDLSKAWGDEYFVGQAILKSPDHACLQFKKCKVDEGGKPIFKADAKGNRIMDLEKDPTQRIVCTGKDVLQYEWAERVVYVYPLDKEVRQKALQQGPLPFLFNMKAAEAKVRYGMTLLKQNDREYLISVVPNEQIDKESFTQAFVWLSKENFLPRQLQLFPVQNEQGQNKETQEFKFTSIKPNAAVDDGLFNPVLQMTGWEVKHNPAEGAAPAPRAEARPNAGPGRASAPTRRQPPPQPAMRPAPRPQ